MSVASDFGTRRWIATLQMARFLLMALKSPCRTGSNQLRPKFHIRKPKQFSELRKAGYLSSTFHGFVSIRGKNPAPLHGGRRRPGIGLAIPSSGRAAVRTPPMRSSSLAYISLLLNHRQPLKAALGTFRMPTLQASGLFLAHLSYFTCGPRQGALPRMTYSTSVQRPTRIHALTALFHNAICMDLGVLPCSGS